MEIVNQIRHLDFSVLQFVNLHRNVSFDNFFILFTNSAAPVTFGLPVILFVISIVVRNELLTEKAYLISVAIFCSVISSSAFKYLINRPRPFITHPIIQKIGDGGSPSFPSGHTCDAFVLSACLGLLYPKWYIVLPAYAWAFIVAYSRIDLGVHYPSDVLGGILIGTTSAIIAYSARLRFKRFFYLIQNKK